MAEKRWQIWSDDKVWFLPAEVVLSTVEIPLSVTLTIPASGRSFYETCIFRRNNSEVLAKYASQDDAEKGHSEFEQQFRLTRCTEPPRFP